MGISTIIDKLGLGASDSQIGIALGGGGARGFVHLGVLDALNEQGVVPDVITGTSAGAIVGALIADGMAPRKAHALLKKKDFFGYSKFQWPKDGLFGLDGLEEVLKAALSVEKIEETSIRFIPTVTNLNTGKVEYMTEGPLVQSVLASASIPFIFKVMEIEGSKYADGGILDNLPLRPLLDLCQKTIAVSISPVRESDDLDSIVKIAARTFQLGVNAQNQDIESKCTLFIEPDGIEKYDLFDNKQADELFEMGYEHVKKLDVASMLNN